MKCVQLGYLQPVAGLAASGSKGRRLTTSASSNTLKPPRATGAASDAHGSPLDLAKIPPTMSQMPRPTSAMTRRLRASRSHRNAPTNMTREPLMMRPDQASPRPGMPRTVGRITTAVPNVATSIAATDAPLASAHSGARSWSDTRWRRYPPIAAPRTPAARTKGVVPNSHDMGDAAIPIATTAPPATAISRLIARLASMFVFHHAWSIVLIPPECPGPQHPALETRPRPVCSTRNRTRTAFAERLPGPPHYDQMVSVPSMWAELEPGGSAIVGRDDPAEER